MCPQCIRTEQGAGCSKVKTKCRLPAAGRALLFRGDRREAAALALLASPPHFLSDKSESSLGQELERSAWRQEGADRWVAARFSRWCSMSHWVCSDPAFCTHCLSGLLPRRLQMSTSQPPEECVLCPMSESTTGLPKEQEQPEGGWSQHHPLGGMAACGTNYHRP